MFQTNDFKKIKNIYLTNLRNKNTSRSDFRQNAELISRIIAQETLTIIETETITIQTPIETTIGLQIKPKIMLIPILRSGMSMLEPFLYYFKNASIGVIGLKRDEKTAIAHLYYQNIPKINKSEIVIILDPMIATGGTGLATLKILMQLGATEENIIFASIINSTEGINAIKAEFPKITILQAGIDNKLNNNKFIVPGLGDFGDRYYGTE
jgi:uracil phosphoribosyltransferase